MNVSCVKSIQIAYADDHHISRVGLESICRITDDIRLVCTYGNGRLLLEHLDDHPTVNLILADYEMPGGGPELVRQLKERRPWVKVVILSAHRSQVYAEACIQAGADGYLLKNEHLSKIVDAIREIMRGPAATPEWQERRILSRLTARELEIVDCLVKARRPKQIAEELGISVFTVRAHIRSINGKLGISSVSELLRLVQEEDVGTG